MSRWPLRALSSVWICLAFWAGSAVPAAAQSAANAAMAERLRAGLEAVCPALPEEGLEILVEQPLLRAGELLGQRRVLRLAGHPGLRVDLTSLQGQVRRLILVLEEPGTGEEPRPLATLRADGACRVVDARALRYDSEGRPESLVFLAPDLESEIGSEPLNPPLPPGRDPGGVRVGLVDSGVAYQLPEIAGRLARDAEGRARGFDFWDLDERPYDANPAASAFYPQHHGTTVASILIKEAPEAAILPYRYPRPDMARMADLVARAGESGARILAMPLGSNSAEEWQAFQEAAAARPDLLFVVSAGNDGRDIDAEPVYPAAFDLENLLVVTSADDFGRLAPGSNWGAESVDLMVPAEHLAVFDHRGAAGRASGSSYAVPRVAAIAARLAAQHSDWRAAEIKQAILEHAVASPYERRTVVKHGWIANPLEIP